MILRSLLPLLLLAACAPVEAPLLEPLPNPQPALGARVGDTRVSGPVSGPNSTSPAQVSIGSQPLVSLAPAGGGSGEVGGIPAGGPADISLDFADTDVREVVAQVLGTVLRLNYTIDPAVRGTATLRTPRPLTRAQALAALNTLLAQNGAALVQAGALYRVLPAAAAAAAPGLADPAAAAAAGASLVPLRYASAEDLARVLQPFVANGGRIVADPGRNALLVSGDPTARATLLGLIAAFDINLLAGQSYAVFPVSAGDARDYATALQEALRGQGAGAGQGGGALAGVVRVVPMQRINAVLVVSSQPRYIEDTRRLYALVERTRRANVRGWSVYYLQNSRSNDIAYVLQQAFTPRNVTAVPTPAGATAPGRAIRQFGAGGYGAGGYGTGGAGGSGIGVPGGIGLGGRSGGLGLAAQSGVPGLGQAQAGIPGAPGIQATPDASSNPLLGGLEPGGAGSADTPVDGMRIIPNPQNNALLVYATPQERDTVENTLRRLDILPLQVRIDATIAEVSLNDQLQYGTQFFFRTGEFNNALSVAGVVTDAAGAIATGGLTTAIPGFVFSGRNGGGAPLAISALQAVTDVRVLSSPQLVVLDNEPARLQVGQLVPFLTQTSQSTIVNNAPIVSSVDYRETGVIMEVTPRVNSGGLVTLDISQEVSDVAPGTTTPGVNSPTFSQRVVRTRVAVQDGQTVGLAGLIRDNVNRTNSGIPWLSNVPLLGALFSQQGNTRQRTELLVLITPRVIYDQRDARALTEDLRDGLLNAAALPAQLQALPPSGSADPQARLRRRLRLDR